MNRALRRLFWCLIPAVVACDTDSSSPTAPDTGMSRAFFEGQVRDFYVQGILGAPWRVERGERATIRVSHSLESGEERHYSSSLTSSYSELEDSWLTVQTRYHSWSIPIQVLTLGEADTGDWVRAVGIDASDASASLPGHLGRTHIYTTVHDDAVPHNLLQGTSLQHIDAASITRGTLDISSIAPDGRRWVIQIQIGN